MIIKKQGENHWQIKTQKSTISFNDTESINDFKIPGNGEYEVGGVETDVLDGIFKFYSENIQVAFIKENKKQFSPSEIKKIGDVDILFLPVAGKNTMDIKSALKLISEIEPDIVIPIYYDNLASFTKEEGVNALEVDELKIDKNDLSGEERKVYILK